MAKRTYKDLLLDPLWQAKRIEILRRDQMTCQLCEDTRTTLHVHHTKYKGAPWEIPNDQLKTLCAHCHDVSHKLPGYEISRVIKTQSLEYSCWRMVAHTNKGIVFLYMFFTDVENRSSLPTETIIVHTTLQAA